MLTLTDKTILILSPQSWGRMYISKHHYAIELARQGNRVYFLNPPDEAGAAVAGSKPPPGKRGAADNGDAGKRGATDNGDAGKGGAAGKGGTDKGDAAGRKSIRIEPSGVQENLWLISHRLWFPYILKFHAMPLFHAGMRMHLKKILKAIGRPIDIVWSFDLGNLCPISFLSRPVYRVFHPVDEPSGPQSIAAARGSDVIFSVTREILDKYKAFPAPRHFINHGISSEFLRSCDPGRVRGNPIRVGMAGNLLRADIDRPSMLRIVRENKNVVFECWGPYTGAQSNIGGGGDPATAAFIGALQESPNVILHGAVPATELAKGFAGMDAFLICYDIQKDQSGGTNYHKIIEYLSTGKVIISNNVTTYAGMPVLIQMTAERDNNDKLPALFGAVIANLDEHNDPGKQQERIAFARDNTYSRQVERIDSLIKDNR